MKFNTQVPQKVLLFSLVIILQFSCSKDNDLLTDYVLSETQNTLDIGQLVIDDTFVVNSRGSITLDVLTNDAFESPEEVVITETSTPSNGSVEINTDNTLTYTPKTTEETITSDTSEAIEDTFTYTAEYVEEDGMVGTETGTVTITAKSTNLSQVMFTATQIDLMVSRTTNGFSRPGTNGQDITMMVNEAAQFLKSPSTGRLDWMPTSNLHDCFTGCDPVPTNVVNSGHYVDDNIFYAGLYAFILANRNESGDLAYAKQLANAIATQTLARTKDAGLDFSNRTTYPINTETNPYFLISTWLEKTLNNWSLIKSMDLVDNLTAEEETLIDNWFKDGRDWAYAKVNIYPTLAFGANWRTKPVSNGYNYATPSMVAIDGVAQSAYEGNYAFHSVWANIPSHHVRYVQSYGLLYQDQAAYDLGKEWYENYFKYHVFPDGTSYEMQRAKYNIPSQGLAYWQVTMTGLTMMANTHAVAVLNGNPIVNGRSYSEYYDYTTSEGLSDFLPSHVGGDTKGGIKGLENYMIAFGKYLGQTDGTKNLWGTYRQVNQSPYPNHIIEDRYAYFIPMAQANAYYNNSTIKNIYSGEGGYQKPKTYAEGAGYQAAWKESFMGTFGSYLVAFPYLETEGLYNEG